MGVSIGVPKETLEGERRVAAVPEVVGKWVKGGAAVRIERGAGASAGWPDSAYEEVGATIASDLAATVADADLVLKVNRPAAQELEQLPRGCALVAMLAPLSDADGIRAIAGHDIAGFALELMPRISRAQSMDVLSSQSTVSGYRAVLLGAHALDKLFPLLMTAAGTVAPAKVLVLGAGVAGLQAIATARRLGAVVSAYDTRAAVREQVESLGGKFVMLTGAADGEAEGGYARELTPEEQAAQREELATHIAASDVVITTALVPGRPAPKLIDRPTVERMRPGAVIVDLAGETGGNCEVSVWGEDVVHAGVHVIAPRNLPAEHPYHASQLYARNLANFLEVLLDEEGNIDADSEDELVVGTCVCRGGDVVHPRLREMLGLESATPAGGPS